MAKRDPDTEWLMRHDAPRTHRRKVRYPIKTSAPRCDRCKKAWAPWVDHAECKEKS